MNRLTETVMRRPVAIVVIVVALFIFGAQSIMGMNLQLIPDMDLPVELIMVVYPGASPEDVDKLVTKPIEDGVGTVKGVDTVASYSLENMGLVMLQFEYGTDMDKAFIDVQEAMERVKMTLPDDAENPSVISMDVNAAPVMNLAVESLSEGADALPFVNDIVEDAITRIADVAEVSVSGGVSQYISVEARPEFLTQYNLSLSDISNAVASATFTIPAGNVDYGGQEVNVSATAEYKTPEEIQNIPITLKSGDVIRVSDVAHVYYKDDDKSSYSRYNGAENVSISITKNQSSSAVTLSNKVKKLVKELNETYPDYNIEVTYDSAETILSSLKNIGLTLILGIVITMAVLLIFFGDLKGSLIVASSMPVSVLMTLILMGFMKFSLNMLTMGALVIAIGMMVDNSIVVIEMCFREKDKGNDFFAAALDGTSVVMSSIIASTITTVVVYLPLAMMEGLSGQMFGQLGYTIVFALIASLISAITLVPLCFSVYKPHEKKESAINHFLEAFGERYTGVLRVFLKHRILTFVVTIAVFGVTIFLCRFLNMELMSSSDEGRVSVSVEFRPGTKVETIDAKVKEIEEFVSQSPYIKNYSGRAGSGSGSVMSMGSAGTGTVTANLLDEYKTSDVVDEWSEALKPYGENCDITVSSSASSGMSGMGSSDNSYEVRLNGSDLDELKEASRIAVHALSALPGVLNVSSSMAEAENRADVRIDPVRAAAMNVSPAAAASAVRQRITGIDARDVTIDEQDYTITVEYPEGTYDDINDVYGIMVTGNMGNPVPITEIADIEFTDSPTTIRKNEGDYIASITCAITSATRFETQKAIDEAVADLKLPGSVYQGVNTMQEMMKEEFASLGRAILIAVFLVFMVMAIQFNNIRYSALIMFCIPFSLIGSVILLLLTRSTISMTSLMGFLMLMGIVVNNGIIFVDYTSMLREQGMETMEALVETGRSRLRPILMTTLTTVLSMIPLAVGAGRNANTTRGMAVVIIGGLTASTILTLLILPTFYMIIHKRSKDRSEKKKLKALKKSGIIDELD